MQVLHNRYVNGSVPRRQAVLGIDLGTSGVKALVAGADGGVLGRGMAGYPVRVPASGRAESAPGTGGSPRGRPSARPSRRRTASPSPPWPSPGRCTGSCSSTTGARRSGQAILWLDQRAAAEAATYAGTALRVHGRARQPAVARHGGAAAFLAHDPRAVHRPCRLVGAAAQGLAPPAAHRAGRHRPDRRVRHAPVRPGAGTPGPTLSSRSSACQGRSSPRSAARPTSPGTCSAARPPTSACQRESRWPSARRTPPRPCSPPASSADEAMLNLGSGGQWVVRKTEFRPAAMPTAPRTCTGPSATATTAWPRCRTWASPSTGCATSLGATWDELYDTASRPRRADAPALRPLPVTGALEPGRHRRLDRPHPRPRAGRPDAQRPRRGGRPAARSAWTTSAPPATHRGG